MFVVEFPIGKEGIPMNDRINEKVGAWLLIEGNTRESLANAIGISRPTLNDRLDGSVKWKWEEVVRLSQLLGCSLNELADMEQAVV